MNLKYAMSLFSAAAGLLAMNALLSSHAAESTGVRVVQEGAAPHASGLYVPDRAPLQPTAFMKLPIGDITPKGWLRHQLERDASGISGRMPEISDYLKYEGNGWVDPQSKIGWEELPYWLRGYGDLGYVLNDPRIIKETRKWIDGIFAAQRPDGWFGPEPLKTGLDGKPDMWPHMPILNAVQSYYEFSADPRALTFLTNYFRWQNTLAPECFRGGWGGVRWGDNLETVYWLYNRTGDAWLLDLARKIHKNSADYMTGMPTWHNVNIAQGFREPAEYGLQAKDPRFLRATEKDYDRVMTLYGQFSGGGFAGDENCRPLFHDPRQGFETCGMVEYMHSFEMLTLISGNPLWSDRCEDVAFNSLPAALTPDHKGIHYITSANLIQIDGQGKQHSQFANGTFPMLAFKPGIHDYRCCPHNYGMGWPYYAESLWLATSDNGLCASLYAASDVKAKVGAGTEIKIAEETGYPFESTVRLIFSTSKAVRFPLYLRVPRWCDHPSIKVNGELVKQKAGPLSYVILDRTWSSGDRVTLALPMHVSMQTWTRNNNSVSVDYGPLSFSLDIQEKWRRDGGSADWPEFDVLPASAWNYGLVFDPNTPARSFEIEHKPGPISDEPFTHDGNPIVLRTRARKIPDWQADSDNVVGVLGPSPVRTQEPLATIRLIPMGAARLRITSFPIAGAGPVAHDWKEIRWPKASASFVSGGDSVAALNDGLKPARSHDDSIPRFTWWDHLGSTEWVQYEFEKPRTVTETSVYWYDDTGTGRCRVPKTWRLLYRDGNEWKPVEAASDYGTALDRYNLIHFTPVTTSALRLEAQLQEGFSGGILQWKVEHSQ